MKKENFGQTVSGQAATLYTLENNNGMKIRVTDFGATLVNVVVKDKDGNDTDVVLGYDDVAGYEAGTCFFGATVGRNANRIGGAAFELNGKHYELTANEKNNNLHSGLDFYNKRLWEVKNAGGDSVTFALFSPDKDQGYPGDLRIEVSYTLTEENEIRISYKGICSQDTILNMTNHSYFNLNGEGGGTTLNHEVQIDSDAFTEIDEALIPTGVLSDVAGTPMDFRKAKLIGKEINEDFGPLNIAGGYDHNWVLKNRGKFEKVAKVFSKQTGIGMEIYTDLPGMQMYTSNGLEQEAGKGGKVYGKHGGICFETQYFPDAIHHENFEAPICKADEIFQTKTIYKFKNME